MYVWIVWRPAPTRPKYGICWNIVGAYYVRCFSTVTHIYGPSWILMTSPARIYTSWNITDCWVYSVRFSLCFVRDGRKWPRWVLILGAMTQGFKTSRACWLRHLWSYRPSNWGLKQGRFWSVSMAVVENYCCYFAMILGASLESKHWTEQR